MSTNVEKFQYFIKGWANKGVHIIFKNGYQKNKFNPPIAAFYFDNDGKRTELTIVETMVSVPKEILCNDMDRKYLLGSFNVITYQSMNWYIWLDEETGFIKVYGPSMRDVSSAIARLCDKFDDILSKNYHSQKMKIMKPYNRLQSLRGVESEYFSLVAKVTTVKEAEVPEAVPEAVPEVVQEVSAEAAVEAAAEAVPEAAAEAAAEAVPEAEAEVPEVPEKMKYLDVAAKTPSPYGMLCKVNFHSIGRFN
jgi:hypothetical protein